MSTIWAAPAPTRVLNLRGAPVAERRPGDDDDDTDDPATGPHGAKPSSSRAGDEPGFEDVAGAARGPRVGRIDAWRDQGFASAREQRDALKSDLGRYNARRRGQGRAPLTEDEFDAMIARGNNDEVSSISGSDDSDSDSDSDDGEDGGEAGEGRGAYAAVRGAEQGGAQIVFEDDAGDVAFAVWRCVLEDGRKDAPRLDANGAVRALKALRDGAKPWAVVLARGGHFAASVFDPTKFAGGTDAGRRVEKKPKGPIENVVPPAAAVLHKTFHRYVVRAKAGGRQSTKDAGGGKTIKSAGSSMRRANERALSEEIRECLSDWRSVLNGCALIFVSASKTDQRTLFESNPGKGKEPCLARGDERVRRVPFATRRPTFNETRRVVARLASASPVEVTAGVGADPGGADPVGADPVGADPGGAESLTDAQRERMAQIESRASAAAAALRGLDLFGDGAGVHAGGDDGDDGGDASGGKPLSKKEKEKLKRQRAKERAKAAAAVDGEKGPAPAPPPPQPEPARSRVGKSGGGGKAAALLAKAKQGEANKRNEAVRAMHDSPPPPDLFSRPEPTPRVFRVFIPDVSPPENSRRRVSTDFSRPSPQSEERRASGQRRRGQRRSRGRRTGERSPEAAGPSLAARAAAAARGIDPTALLPKAAFVAAALTVVMSASAGAKRRDGPLGNGGGFRRVMR